MKILPKIRQPLKRDAEEQSRETTSVAQLESKYIFQANCVPSRMLYTNPSSPGGAGAGELLTDEPASPQYSISVLNLLMFTYISVILCSHHFIRLLGGKALKHVITIQQHVSLTLQNSGKKRRAYAIIA